MTIKEGFGLLTRVVVGGVLIYSGVSKALAPSAEFAAALTAYKLLPSDFTQGVAFVWPWIELLTGTYVLFGYYTHIFTRVAAAMFSLFLLILGTTLLRGIDPGSCGCFGAGLSFSVRQTMALDSFLLALAVASVLLSKEKPAYSADAWASR